METIKLDMKCSDKPLQKKQTKHKSSNLFILVKFNMEQLVFEILAEIMLILNHARVRFIQADVHVAKS